MRTYRLAIHPDNGSWKIALLCLHRGKTEIVFLQSLHLSEIPLDTLKPFLQEKPFLIASALEADLWILRHLTIEVKGRKNALAALPFQVEDILPFPKEQAVILPLEEEETNKKNHLTLIITQLKALENHLSFLNQSNIDPQIVTTTLHALKSWTQFVLPNCKTFFLVYAQKENGFAAFIQNDKIIDVKTLCFDSPGPWRRLKEYFLSVSQEAGVAPQITLGNLALLEEVPPSPLQNLDPSLTEYALPIGIALHALKNNKDLVQFRSGDLRSPVLKNKEKKFLKLSLCFSLFAFLSFGPIGHWLLHKHGEALIPRALFALEKLGSSSKQKDIEKLLELLATKNHELEQEGRLGAHFPMVTWFFDQLAEASVSIERKNLPIISEINYSLDQKGLPRFDIQWSCKDKTTARTIKNHLKKVSNLRIVQWKEQGTSYLITLELEV